MGGLTHGLEINTFEIARELARRLGAECQYLAAPIYAGSPRSRDTILAQDVFQEAFERIAQNDIALLSTGDLSDRSLLIRYGLPKDVTPDDLAARGAVGDVLGQFFDRDGRPVDHPLNRRAIALPLEALSRIPTVVLVVGRGQQDGRDRRRAPGPARLRADLRRGHRPGRRRDRRGFGGVTLFLGIDVGTSGVKAALVDADDAVRAEATAPLSVDRPRPLWSEQDPDAGGARSPRRWTGSPKTIPSPWGRSPPSACRARCSASPCSTGPTGRSGRRCCGTTAAPAPSAASWRRRSRISRG